MPRKVAKIDSDAIDGVPSIDRFFWLEHANGTRRGYHEPKGQHRKKKVLMKHVVRPVTASVLARLKKKALGEAEERGSQRAV